VEPITICVLAACINTSDPKKYIERKAAFDDSLRHHKAYLFQDALTPGHYKVNNRDWKYKTGKDKGWATEKAMFDDITGLGPCPSNRPNCWDEEKKLIKYYKSLGFTDKDIQYHTTPDIVTNRMKPSGSYSDYPNGFANPIYKKPVQEVIFEEPQKKIIEKKIIKPTTRTVYVDCPSGSVPNGQTKDVTTPDPESPGNYLRTITASCELEKIKNLPILKPGLIKQKNYELQGVVEDDETLELSDEKNEEEENAIEEYKTGKIKSETDRRINWNGIEVPYRLLGWKFRYPEHWDRGLINTKLKGKKRYFHLPTIEKRKNTYILDSDKNKKYITINDYKQYGGINNNYIETDLNEDEIEEYRRGGYIIEEIDNYQDGGIYTVKGSKGAYKKVNGKWQVDWNRSGKYQPLSKGDVKARTAVLDKMAKPVDNGISKISSNSSDNTRVNNIYQKPLDWSFDPKYKNNIQAFVKKSSEEKEKAIQKEKEDSKIKKGLANNEGIKETVGQFNKRQDDWEHSNILNRLFTDAPESNYLPQPKGGPIPGSEFITGIGGAPKMILQAGKWLKPLWTATKTSVKAPLPLGKKITDATGGKLNLGNSVAAYFGADALYNQVDSKSDVVKSQSNFINNPSWNTLGDASFETGVNALGFSGLGLGKQVFKPAIKGLKKYSKPLINSIDNTIYPTRTYSARLPGGNKTSYEVSDLSKKIFKKGDWSTKSLDEARQYLSGSEATGRKGLLTGNDMIFTEYKVPFWKKNVSFDRDVVNLKNSQGVDINKGEFIIPNNKFLYPRKTTYIKAVPEHLKTAKTNLSTGDIEYSPFAIPLGPSSTQFASKPYKYIEDQINAASGHNMPLTYIYNPSLGYNQNIPLYDWKQPQFPINKRFKQGGASNDYVELDLTSEEIKDLIAQGYVIEELN